MWESPDQVWRRLNIWREEYLQRLMTTLIVGGNPPPWNTARAPSVEGAAFLQRLDELAYGDEHDVPSDMQFVDEFMLPKIEEAAPNGWPDWAVVSPDRLWVIELKTEAGSHRPNQLPYYLRLASNAHPRKRVDLTYITGPLAKPPPVVREGQRFSHIQWANVLPLVEAVWGNTRHEAVLAYVRAIRTVIDNLAVLGPMEQRDAIITQKHRVPQNHLAVDAADAYAESPVVVDVASGNLLELAKATAADGKQRGVGAGSAEDLERLRDAARSTIGLLPSDDEARFVMPWVWIADRSTGAALSPEGAEFGYELRFSRYQTIQLP